MPFTMTTKGLAAALFSALMCSAVPAQSNPSPAHPHVFLRVQAAPSLAAPVSGRLLVFLRQGTGDTEIDLQPHPSDTWVAAKEVHDLAPGATIELDADDIAYPAAFSTIPPGDYQVQALLDVDHSYNYTGRVPQDWISPVVTLSHWNPATSPESDLALSQHPAASPQRTAALAKATAQVAPGVAEKIERPSPLLSRFWGRDIKLKAWVILPPGYTAGGTTPYPTVYWTHGFGGNLDSALINGIGLRERMAAGSMPPMIWVMLDESVPQGTHEFADSANNGPWGAALTSELIPWLESRYRMDARPSGRLLNGHSSGGWATLQLQINYPKIFGGTWSTSPDPSDFHNFTGPNLYAANANVYRRPDGSAYPIMRDMGNVIATFQQFAQVESVVGPYGGQMSSFDWVFSPRSDSGAPAPMFDRVTGTVDPQVVAYWHDHYDLAHLVEERWPQLQHDLKGRIHLIVGTADTFYLDGAAHLFEARLQRLGAEPHFTYLPNKTHFDLYTVDTDRTRLFDQISTEMYAVARRGKKWTKGAESAHAAPASPTAR